MWNRIKNTIATRLSWKLYAAYVIVIVLTTATIGGFVAADLARETRRESLEQLSRTAEWLRQTVESFVAETDEEDRPAADAVSDSEPARLGEVVASKLRTQFRDRKSGASGTHLVVYDPTGRPIASSTNATSELAIQPRQFRASSQPMASQSAAAPALVFGDEFEAATERRVTVVVNGRDRSFFYATQPIRNASDVTLGFVLAAIPAADANGRSAELIRAVALGTLLAAAIALGLGLVIAHRVTAPLVAMTEVATQVAAGDYNQRVHSRSVDEIGRLGKVFDDMAVEHGQRLATRNRENNKLLAVIEGMTEGVIAVDPSLRVLHLNDVAAELIGAEAFRSEPTAGLPVRQVSRVPAIEEVLARALESHEESRCELQIRDSSGRDRVVELRAVPMGKSDQPPLGAAAVLHELTELRELESIRQRFVTNVSQELEPPIHIARNALDKALAQAADAVTNSDELRVALNQVGRLSHLVDDLLTVARLESSGERIERAPIDLRDPLVAASGELGSIAENRQLELTIELPSEPVDFTGDPEALRQITYNLLANAIRYTEAGGQVWLRLLASPGSWTIEVQDTGQGIGARHLRRIFERFYRVDKTRSRDLGGTGLGLSIARDLTLAHEGEITVESKVHVGSTFRVTLPIVES